jgi:hypothetical protein
MRCLQTVEPLGRRRGLSVEPTDLLGVDADSLVWPKGSTWVLEVDGGQVTHRRCLPPLRLRDTEAGY